MIQEKAAIIISEEISEGIFSVWLESRIAEEAVPGQFVMLNTNSLAHMMG